MASNLLGGASDFLQGFRLLNNHSEVILIQPRQERPHPVTLPLKKADEAKEFPFTHPCPYYVKRPLREM